MVSGHGGPLAMKKNRSSKRPRGVPKAILRLPDLDHAKAAVLNSLTCPEAQRGYRHAIDEFVDWYCSEPRLAFNKSVVLRYRSHLESRKLAPGTINLRLGAVRRLAYEASDCGLLSPDLAAGIRRVKGVKKLGVRLGNWLTAEQSQALWRAPDAERLKGKRDRALLSILLACGLRRHEVVELTFEHLQQREEHWAIVDLIGESGHIRTIPLPGWVRQLLDVWLSAAGISGGRLFRRVHRTGRIWGEGLTEKARLACGKGIRRENRNRQAGTARPPENVRQALPYSRRRVGANTVSVGPRFRTDYGTILGMQAANPGVP
jgi:integrase